MTGLGEGVDVGRFRIRMGAWNAPGGGETIVREELELEDKIRDGIGVGSFAFLGGWYVVRERTYITVGGLTHHPRRVGCSVHFLVRRRRRRSPSRPGPVL